MSQVFVLLSTSPNDVVNFFQYIKGCFDSPTPSHLYIPEGLLEYSESIEDIKTYPSPNTTWTIPAHSQKAFFIYLDPRSNLIESIDDLADGLRLADLTPDRVITLVDCENTSKSSKLAEYYEACIFHSDIALLAQRSNVSKKWINSYIKSFEKKAVPTFFTFLKKAGKVDNPKYMLFKEALRFSQVFDDEEYIGDSLPFEVDANFDLNSEDEDPSYDPYRPKDKESHPEKRIPDVSSLVNKGKSA